VGGSEVSDVLPAGKDLSLLQEVRAERNGKPLILED
jgi:hypothetical protein